MGLLVAIAALLLASILMPFFYKRSQNAAITFAVSVFLGVFAYVVSLWDKAIGGPHPEFVFPWISSEGIDAAFRADGLSLVFMLLISGIGALVAVFSSAYLTRDRNGGRFFSYLLFFSASMFGVVAADDLILLFVFWELTSLASFLLIGFHNERETSRASALQALLVTGSGGLALLAGFILVGQITGTTRISELLLMGPQIQSHALFVPAALLIMLGAFTKSAQVPLHFWLPGAMVAPTPVSAYLHSATMVKAGVYLLARLFPALGGNDLWLATLVLVGCATSVVGPILALMQTDLKRLLAYSTIGSLGMLVLLLGLGTEDALKAAVVYLVVHALYKGALFMVAGIVDHQAGSRNVEGLCGLMRPMPITAIAAVLAALSMAGIPPLFGFIGKELLYHAKLESPNAGWILYTLSVGSNMATVSIALIVGLEPFMGRKVRSVHKPHDGSILLWVGPLILAMAGLLLGIAPNSVSQPIFSAAASAVNGSPLEVDLSLWHGFNVVLAMSAITFGGGVAIFLFRNLIRRWSARVLRTPLYGPERAYQAVLSSLYRYANFQTGVLQNGRLPVYTGIIVLAAALLLLAALFDGPLKFGELTSLGLDADVFAIALIVMAAAVAAAVSQSRVLLVCCLGVIGFSIAVVYAIFSAPDVALTQVLIETITVALVVFLLSGLPRLSETVSRTETAAKVGVALFFGAVISVFTYVAMSAAGSRDSISSYFAEQSYIAAKGRNIVNVILVDFRALDTLGEITVLVVASVGVATLLLQRRRKSGVGEA